MKKPKSELIEFTENQIKEYIKCKDDIIYFAENYVKIVDIDRGLVLFKPYEFQKKLIADFSNNRHTIVMNSRQCGITLVHIIHILHCLLFNRNYRIAVVANKLSVANEIIKVLKECYFYLPNWIQQGAINWNAHLLELENGSRLLCDGVNSGSLRGNSFNLILIDNFAFIPETALTEFFKCVYPAIVSGKNTKLIISSTPTKQKLFLKLWNGALEGVNSYTPIKIHWSEIPDRNENWKQKTISYIGKEQFDIEYELDLSLLEESKKVQKIKKVSPCGKIKVECDSDLEKEFIQQFLNTVV